jgi:hypothetical protein
MEFGRIMQEKLSDISGNYYYPYIEIPQFTKTFCLLKINITCK